MNKLRNKKAKALRKEVNKKVTKKEVPTTSYDTLFHSKVKRYKDKLGKDKSKEVVMSQIVSNGQRKEYQNLKKGKK